MHLVIGGRGLVGTALVKHLLDERLPVIVTTRQQLDLSKRLPAILPTGDFVYLVAAIPKLVYCEQHPAESWRVNVDAPIALAKYYSRRDTFVTFVSSDAVETCGNTAYGRQKTAAEAFMHTIDAAIVRPSRIPPEKASKLAKFLVDVARWREAGVHHWAAE